MSTLTDPTPTTPPGERIDTEPLWAEVNRAARVAAETGRTLAKHVRADDTGMLPATLDRFDQNIARLDAAETSLWAAIKHNTARAITATEGIAQARQALTAAVARSNGYATADEEAEAAGRDEQEGQA